MAPNSSFCLFFQKLDFLFRQFPGFSPLQLPQRQAALGPALEIQNRHLSRGHHPPDLVVLALADGDQALAFPQGLQLRREADRAVPEGQSGFKGGLI